MLNTKEQLGKFDSKALKCYFLGYSERSKSFRIYNIIHQTVEESIQIRFDDKLDSDQSKLVEKFADLSINVSDKGKAPEEVEPEEDEPEEEAGPSNSQTLKKSRITAAHPKELILGNKDEPVRTRSAFRPSEETLLSLKGWVSLIEPKSIDEALQDKDWILAMEEELNQFSKNDVWSLVKKPESVHVIRTKWVFRNKLNEKGDVV
ncbi:hypothetical protein, partial [Bradyrhizobium sp. TM233]|uniref:hypothetical protein n=1 Tax=Bradyrhizobium sp. TM233 TaxID=2599801 RepID=UPI0030C710CC